MENYNSYRYTLDINQDDLFSPQSIKFMSSKITELLDGVHPQGKRIIVPDKTIISVADSFRNSFSTTEEKRIDIINHIVEDISSEFSQVSENNNFSHWKQYNYEENGLSRNNAIKLFKGRTNRFFSYNY